MLIYYEYINEMLTHFLMQVSVFLSLWSWEHLVLTAIIVRIRIRTISFLADANLIKKFLTHFLIFHSLFSFSSLCSLTTHCCWVLLRCINKHLRTFFQHRDWILCLFIFFKRESKWMHAFWGPSLSHCQLCRTQFSNFNLGKVYLTSR